MVNSDFTVASACHLGARNLGNATPHRIVAGLVPATSIICAPARYSVHAAFRGQRLTATLRPSGLLLLGQDCVKHGLFDIRFQRATRGVDERIGTAIL